MILRKHRLVQSAVSMLLLGMLLSFWTPIAKAASEEPPIDMGVMEITGVLNGGTFELTPETAENLFDLEGAAFPGGTWKKTVRLVNNCPRSMHVALISVTTTDENTLLFDALETKILSKGAVVYEGSYGAGSEDQPMTETFRIPGRQTIELEILVSLDESHGNDMQGSPMDNSIWTFGAWYDYPPESTRAEYYIYYRDEEGNDLHEMKTGQARIGTEVTEQALEIEGYTPDAQEKTIEIQPVDHKNRIVFIYKLNDQNEPEPSIPDPSAPDDPTDPDPDHSEVKPDNPNTPDTGVDLLERNYTRMNMLGLALIVSFAIAIIIIRDLIDENNLFICDSETEGEEENKHDD